MSFGSMSSGFSLGFKGFRVFRVLGFRGFKGFRVFRVLGFREFKGFRVFKF